MTEQVLGRRGRGRQVPKTQAVDLIDIAREIRDHWPQPPRRERYGLAKLVRVCAGVATVGGAVVGISIGFHRLVIGVDARLAFILGVAALLLGLLLAEPLLPRWVTKPAVILFPKVQEAVRVSTMAFSFAMSVTAGAWQWWR